MSDDVKISSVPGLTVTFTFPKNDKSFLSRAMQRFMPDVSSKIEEFLADEFLKEMRTKLRAGALGLIRLSPVTIKRKKDMGMSFVSSPMYGWGEQKQNSYISNMTVRKLGDDKDGGARIRVGVDGRKIHHSGLTMKRLAIMHLEGYSIGDRDVPPRDPISATLKDFRPSTRNQRMAQIMKERVSRLWK